MKVTTVSAKSNLLYGSLSLEHRGRGVKLTRYHIVPKIEWDWTRICIKAPRLTLRYKANPLPSLIGVTVFH